MKGSILQEQPYSELIKLRTYFENRKESHYSGYQRLDSDGVKHANDAIADIDEMILDKYQEETRTFTNHTELDF